MSESEKSRQGSTIFLGNAVLAMSCILVIYSDSDEPIGVARSISLALLSLATPLLVGQYFIQFVFSGYKGNILISILAVGLSIAAYCALVWSIRWWSGLVFSITVWSYYGYIVRKATKAMSGFSNTQPDEK